MPTKLAPAIQFNQEESFAILLPKVPIL